MTFVIYNCMSEAIEMALKVIENQNQLKIKKKYGKNDLFP